MADRTKESVLSQVQTQLGALKSSSGLPFRHLPSGERILSALEQAGVDFRELTDLFAERRHCELDLRSIKDALGMGHLRCKSPEMVRKELWMHLLAYNLIRVRMAQAAAAHGTVPRKLSFTAAKRYIHNFAPYLSANRGSEHCRLEAELLKAIAACRLDSRPGRKEPRAIKKRNQKYSYLTKPRAQAREQLMA